MEWWQARGATEKNMNKTNRSRNRNRNSRQILRE